MWGRSIAMVLKPSESGIVVAVVVAGVVGDVVVVGAMVVAAGEAGFIDQSHLGSHMLLIVP